MRKFLTLQMKQAFRSLWFPIFFGPLLLVGVAQLIQSHGGLSLFWDEGFLLNLYLCIFAVVYGVYTAHQISDYERTVVPNNQLLLTKWLSAFLYSFSGFLVPILLMAISWVVSHASFAFLWNLFSYQILHWVLQSFFFTSLGFFLGCCIHHIVIYLVGFAVVVVTSPFMQLNIPEDWQTLQEQNLLNMLCDNTTYIQHGAYGFSLDRQFWYSFLVYLCLGAALFLLTWLLFGHFVSLRPQLALGASALIVSICVYPLAEAYLRWEPQHLPVSITMEEVVDKLNNTHKNPVVEGLRVTSYDMDVSVGKALTNSCTLVVENTRNTDFSGELPFKLDESFQVQSLQSSGKDIPYLQRGDQLLLADCTIPAQGSVEFHILYEGTPYYWGRFHNKDIFVERGKAQLPFFFAWYPKLETGGNVSTYALQIDTQYPLVTNLTQDRAVDKGEHTLSGSAQDLYVLVGYFDTVEVGDFQVTAPTYYADLPSLEEEFQTWYAAMEDGAKRNMFNASFLPGERISLEDFYKIHHFVFLPFCHNGEGLELLLGETLFCGEYILN